MNCIRPIILGRHIFGCKQCMPCLITRRREWTTRILAESMAHKESCFVTLTYRPISYVQRQSTDYPPDESLRPEHLQGFLKRLRQYYSPYRLRFFACGEYGDHTGRAHFHAVLFGYSWCRGGPQKIVEYEGGACGRECQCKSCLDVRRAWGFGHTSLSPLVAARAAYIAKYVTKKLTTSVSLGKQPEFARMSLSPGIGAPVLGEVALAAAPWKESLAPIIAIAGKQKLPLGRYLKRKLYEANGVQPLQSGGIRALEENADRVRLLRMVAAQCNVSVATVLQQLFAREVPTEKKKGTL